MVEIVIVDKPALFHSVGNRQSIATKVAHDITKYVEQMRAMEREVAELRRERETWRKRAGSKEDGAPSGMPEIQVEI